MLQSSSTLPLHQNQCFSFICYWGPGPKSGAKIQSTFTAGGHHLSAGISGCQAHDSGHSATQQGEGVTKIPVSKVWEKKFYVFSPFSSSSQKQYTHTHISITTVLTIYFVGISKLRISHIPLERSSSSSPTSSCGNRLSLLILTYPYDANSEAQW